MGKDWLATLAHKAEQSWKPGKTSAGRQVAEYDSGVGLSAVAQALRLSTEKRLSLGPGECS